MEYYDCKFIDNYSYDTGGALMLLSPKNLIIKNCYFRNNTSVLGGGTTIVTAK